MVYRYIRYDCDIAFVRGVCHRRIECDNVPEIKYRKTTNWENRTQESLRQTPCKVVLWQGMTTVTIIPLTP